MSAHRIVQELAGRGVRIEDSPEGLSFRDANGVLTDKLIAQLQARTIAIRAVLHAPAPARDPWLDDRHEAGGAHRGFNLVDTMAEYRRRHATSLAFMFHRITGCDLWSRNPTVPEMERFYEFLWGIAPLTAGGATKPQQHVFAGGGS